MPRYNIKAVTENGQQIEVWLSLVERFVRDEEAAGSNPVTSTNGVKPKRFAACFSLYADESLKKIEKVLDRM